MSLDAGGPSCSDWQADLIRRRGRGGELGEILPEEANVCTILREDPRWRGVLAFDLHSRRTVCRRPPPWSEVDQGEHDGAPWSDIDSARLRLWLSRAWSLTVRYPLEPWVEVVARRRPYHEIRDYLDGLEWDGAERLPSWLELYLGAEGSAYASSVGTWWLISAIARVFRPGCQADHTLVLEGETGAGKSTALGILAGTWAMDSSLDLTSADCYLALRGRWIVELSELDSLGRAAAARVKSYLSSRRDVYRPPYGRATVEIPRQCVFAGTTNESTYLRDPTGNRRFWPVTVGQIDLDALRGDRDQLWAEATLRYREGEAWWPRGQEEVGLCSTEQGDRYEADPWEAIVLAWCEGRRDPVDIGQILREALDLESKSITRYHQGRVGGILLRAGWRKTQRIRRGGRRVWLYEAPIEEDT